MSDKTLDALDTIGDETVVVPYDDYAQTAALVEAVGRVREVLPELLEYLEVCYDHENLTADIIRMWIDRLDALKPKGRANE